MRQRELPFRRVVPLGCSAFMGPVLKSAKLLLSWQFRIRCKEVQLKEPCAMTRTKRYEECVLCKRNEHYKENVAMQEEQVVNKSW